MKNKTEIAKSKTKQTVKKNDSNNDSNNDSKNDSNNNKIANPIDVEFSAKGTLKKANDVQDQILDSLKKSTGIAITIKDQGDEVITELAKQGDKINQIEKETEVLSSDLDRAKKDVMWFFRQLAKDKCCVAIILLLIFGIIGIIFVVIYTKRESDNKSINTNTNTTTILPHA
jgi:hypothetical protein